MVGIPPFELSEIGYRKKEANMITKFKKEPNLKPMSLFDLNKIVAEIEKLFEDKK